MKHLVVRAAVVAALFAVTGVAPAAVVAQEAPAQERPALSGRFLLVDQDGRAVDQDSYRGKLRIMTFGYTFCPDVCPTTLSTVAGALAKLGPAADQVVPIFVSVDPGRDSPAHLKEYLAAFDPRFVGLTGTADAVATAARNFHVRYAVRPADNGDPNAYSVDHSAGIFIMDRNGNFLAKLGHLEDADAVAARIRGYLG